ncbi:RAB7A-interacting MON1-CCZ1 complex subunit 1 [Rhipicephalus sanguineus]|uniref:RAB7A-interacting MON1-CCZ1 complex subunit 1 n=1 Tax=Rhipicephalus sanguineus TaxID=34632 RepID=UPI001895DF64|nr:RAB7A-interacting MON1-CCZ1 complex subunit 1 [Rhipicephalus sanguineus]
MMEEAAAKEFTDEVDDLIRIVEDLKIRSVVPSLLESSFSKLLELKSRLRREEISRETANKEVLQDLAKIVLDVTYCRENRLADNDFSDSDSLERVHAIIRSLEHVENITKHMGFSTVVEGLGEELAECIEWRKGGLVYMFCQSKEGDDDHSWIMANQETFLALLQQGVQHLTAMLNVRRPLSAEDVTVLSGQTDVLELLEKGIYSDVHALSLMYAGEMCFWLVTYSKRWDRPLDMVHALPLGKRLLQDYISAVEGPLQDAGWNCTRARQLLAQLEEEEQC